MMKTIFAKAWPTLVALLLANSVIAAPIQLRSMTIPDQYNDSSLSALADSSSLYLVEWNQVVTEDKKLELEQAGGQILGFIPDSTFLVRSSNPTQMTSLPFVERVVRYRASMKAETGLAKATLEREAPLVVVELAKDSSADEVRPYAVGPIMSFGKNAILVRIENDRIFEVAALDSVVWMERYVAPRLLDLSAKDLGVDVSKDVATPPPALTGFESGTRGISSEAAYSAGFSGAGQIVAFADTGLDQGNINSIIADFRGQVKSGHAIALGGMSWGDPQSHGTHVAGSIAGNGASSGGAIRGAAWGAKLVALGMWSDILNNFFPPSAEVILRTAYDQGARIHSNSWGRDSQGGYDSMARQVDTYLYDKPDLLAVFAAGNSGADMNKDGVIDEKSVGSPATAKNVLSVGASKNLLLNGGIQKPMKELRDGASKWGAEPIASSFLSEDLKGMAAFSSRGPTADGRIKPDLVAPGTNIVSARSSHPKAGEGWGVFDPNYLYMGGTSMATPILSGALAVQREFLLKKLGRPTISAALMKAYAVASADDLFPGQFGVRPQGQEQPTTRPNNHQGWGRITLASLADTASVMELTDNTTGLATGEELKLNWTLAQPGTRSLRIAMAYTDAPAAANSQVELVNDLDIELTTPSGAKLFPNGKASADNRNNLESIDLATQEAGVYELVIRGRNIPQGRAGKQAFALVVIR
jgi:serine protease AprX